MVVTVRKSNARFAVTFELCHSLCAHMWKTHLKIQFAIPFEKSLRYSSILYCLCYRCEWCKWFVEKGCTVSVLLYDFHPAENKMGDKIWTQGHHMCVTVLLVCPGWPPDVSVCWAHGLIVGAMCSHVDCLSPPILLLNHCFSGSSCVSLVTLVCLPI